MWETFEPIQDGYNNEMTSWRVLLACLTAIEKIQ
jgi:hypothetical protein